LLVAGLIGGLVTFALMGGFKGSESSDLPAQNLASGLVNSVRVGDPAACQMLTSSGQADLVRLLGTSPATAASLAAQGLAVCATVLVNASPSARRHAMLPFLGVIGFGTSDGGGSTTSGSEIDWSETKDGRYAVVTLHNYGAQGWLASSMRVQANCRACNA
jgi:hypothetical protein